MSAENVLRGDELESKMLSSGMNGSRKKGTMGIILWRNFSSSLFKQLNADLTKSDSLFLMSRWWNLSSREDCIGLTSNPLIGFTSGPSRDWSVSISDELWDWSCWWSWDSSLRILLLASTFSYGHRSPPDNYTIHDNQNLFMIVDIPFIIIKYRSW